MACPTCGKSQASTPVPSESESLNYSTALTQVASRRGGMLPIAGPLVDDSTPPRGSWRVMIPVAGHTQEVKGGSPKAVFNNAKSLLERNGVTISDANLWLNLNIQWLQRVTKAHLQPVTLEELMAVATGNPPPQVAYVSKANVPPKVWGSKGWAMLQTYLSMDNYDHGRFLLLANELANWVNPDLNPSKGCADCYRHYLAALAEIRQYANRTQAEAREWLVKTMNAVNLRNGKKALTMAEAATLNHWT